MALRNPTDEETQRIIRSSLGTVVAFEHGANDPAFLEEIVPWEDILAIPPVTKAFLHTHTLVTVVFEIPHSSATMNRKLFFRHLDKTESETVEEYRDFLKDLILVEEDA